MGGSEVGNKDDPGVAVERQHGRRAAAGGGVAACLIDELLLEECVDTLGDGRAREPGRPGEVGSRHRDLLPDQAKERTGAGR